MRYDWKILDAGPLALDGGGMFGVVPKVLWEKITPPDERNRVTLTHNCLLLTDEAGKHTLIETGSGGKFDAKMRDIFGLSNRDIRVALHAENVDPAAIETVIVTHLHFDHAGGLTHLAGDNEAADWEGHGERVMRSFPNAKVFVQQQEWDDALANRSVMTRTYLPSHLEPIREQVELINTPDPTGDDWPSEEVRPGISLMKMPGHTWGQQGVRFTDSGGRTVVFVPDVIPTVHHAAPAYSMSYDVEPYTNMLTRERLLKAAEANDWLLVLDHEPRTPAVRVSRDEKGRAKLTADDSVQVPTRQES